MFWNKYYMLIVDTVQQTKGMSFAELRFLNTDIRELIVQPHWWWTDAPDRATALISTHRKQVWLTWPHLPAIPTPSVFSITKRNTTLTHAWLLLAMIKNKMSMQTIIYHIIKYHKGLEIKEKIKLPDTLNSQVYAYNVKKLSFKKLNTFLWRNGKTSCR